MYKYKVTKIEVTFSRQCAGLRLRRSYHGLHYMAGRHKTASFHMLVTEDCKAGVKWTNIVGPPVWADKSWTISTMWKPGWSTWSHKICILVSVKHFSPTNVCVVTFTETDLSQTSNSSRSLTQEAVNMAPPCWKLLWGWYVSRFKLMEDQEWAKMNVKSTGDV